MSAAKTIAAAIEKLEKLRAESTQPTGGTSWIQGNDRKPHETSGEIYTGPLSDVSGDVASWIAPADAALIVALHRSIDPQLEILRDAARAWADPLPMAMFGGGDMRSGIYHFHEQLALAILGRPS